MAGPSWLLIGTGSFLIAFPAGVVGLKPESEGILFAILGFLYVAFVFAKKLHEGQKKLKAIEESKERDKKAVQEAADKKIDQAKSEFQETLERINNALKEENIQLRERMAKQEVMALMFKEQYDKTVVILQEKNQAIQNLSFELGQFKEENTQLKRRLHGKRRQGTDDVQQ